MNVPTRAVLLLATTGALLCSSGATAFAALQNVSIPLVPAQASTPGADVDLIPGGGFHISALADLAEPPSATEAAPLVVAPGVTDPIGVVSAWHLDYSAVCGGNPSALRSIRLVFATSTDHGDSVQDGVVALVSDGAGNSVPVTSIATGADTAALGVPGAVYRGLGGVLSTTGTIDATWPVTSGSLIHLWHATNSIPYAQGLNVHTTLTSASVSYEDAGCNRAPVAVDDSGTAPAGGSVTVGPLSNDSDPDGDSLSIREIDGQAVAVGGTVSLADGKAVVRLNADGTFTVIPSAGITEPISFDYKISDGTLTSTARVTITITPPAPNPVTITPPAPTPPVAAPAKPRLSVTIKVNSHTVATGREVKFVVTGSVKDALGNSVRVCATLPEGVKVVRVSAGASRKGGVVCAAVSRIEAGGGKKFTITARVINGAAGHPLVARASIAASGARSAKARTNVRVIARRPASAETPMRFTG